MHQARIGRDGVPALEIVEDAADLDTAGAGFVGNAGCFGVEDEGAAKSHVKDRSFSESRASSASNTHANAIERLTYAIERLSHGRKSLDAIIKMELTGI